MTSRIESLDWLRGLMAISIMLYHLTGNLFFKLNSSTLLGRLGVYGVSIFFILSGLSMALVYSKYINNIKTSVYFFIRRIFRIWPLLWMSIALIVIPSFLLMRGNYSVLLVISNLTTIFGFVKPEAYINTGAWSIGNEMVYYSLTPLVIIFYNKKKILGDVITLISFIIFCYFSFYLLNANNTLASQWTIYINPFNNLFLYIAGIAIYYNLKGKKINQLFNLLLLISAILLMTFYNVAGDQINIATGVNRLIFALLSLVIVISFYKFEYLTRIPKFIRNVFETFGIATYGVYLLHPIVLLYLSVLLHKLGVYNNIIQFFFAIAITSIVAILSFNLVEKRIIKIGKRLTGGQNQKTGG